MKNRVIAILGVLLASIASAHVGSAVVNLNGSSWQLMRFRSADGSTLVPPDKSKYTIAFGDTGRVAVRIDCNRGFGSWRLGGRDEIELGPLALTRAACPPHPLTDRMPRDWESIRKFVIANDRLSLSLVDGGAYEFEPIPK